MAISRRWMGVALLAAAPSVLSGQAVPSPAAPPSAVVRAVLFYSPTCPHCHRVMTEDLPPLFARYGTGLRIAGVDVTTAGGQTLYRAMVRVFALPTDRLGVPALVVGPRVLVGEFEIPAEFPGIIERGLAAGGIDWPDVPEVRQALALAEQAAARPHDTAAAAPRAPAESLPSAAVPVGADTHPSRRRDTAVAGQAPRAAAAAPERIRKSAPAAVSPPAHPAPAPGTTPADSHPGGAGHGVKPLGGAAGGTQTSVRTVRDRFLRDPVGNGASVAVLLGMVAD